MLDVSTSLTTVGNSGCLTWVRHSSPKSSATHSYLCVQHFPVSKQRYGCQRLGFVTCAQMLMHATAHGGRTNTVRESALEADSGRKYLAARGNQTRIGVASVFFGQMLYHSIPTPFQVPKTSSKKAGHMHTLKIKIKTVPHYCIHHVSHIF